MPALSNGPHDPLLHRRPVKDDLGVGHANHLVPEQRKFCIVLVVAAALCARVLAAIDLQDETVPNEKVHAVPVKPGLRHDSQPKPSQSRAHVALKARVGKPVACKKHILRATCQWQFRERLPLDEPPELTAFWWFRLFWL